ncbi:MAG: type II secretion system GspH family protein, partial [Planctomycetes bacterium]|nr:type II secretion system GspH family protein [Planctomycetota bacterium]
MFKNLWKAERKINAFTLIELLVVIAIIAILTTLSVLALQSAREKARNSKRIADIKQLKTALELYYNDANGYPPASAFVTGSALSYTDSQSGQVNTYINQIPSSPIPADGDCTQQNNSYSYSSANPSTYTLSYCLGGNTQSIPDGINIATPAQLYSLAQSQSGNESCTDTTWTPDPSTYCGDATQTSNCDNTRTTTGTLSCSSPATCGGGGTANQCGQPACTDTTWTPDPATYCGDATQTSNCNATRTTAGTLSCSSPTPVCNNNICVECTDNSTCTLPQTCAGSGTPNVCGCSDATWTPDPSSYCG